MVRRTKTIEIDYNWFEPGTLVTPGTTRCPLNVEHVYRVMECYEPHGEGDMGICFVGGHHHGIATSGLREVRPEELTEDGTRLKRPNFWYATEGETAG